jgi:hypothetical protein
VQVDGLSKDGSTQGKVINPIFAVLISPNLDAFFFTVSTVVKHGTHTWGFSVYADFSF